MMHEVSLCLLFLSVDARLNQRRLQTLSGSANADVLWSHQFGSGCQVNTAPLVVDQNVLVSVGSEETLRSVQFTDNASTESWLRGPSHRRHLHWHAGCAHLPGANGRHEGVV